MKFLILSDAGDGMGLAYRIQEEGNTVSLWMRSDNSGSIGSGLMKDLEDMDFEPDPTDTVVIADCTGFGQFMDMFKAAGYSTLGGSRLMDRLERDRKYSSKVMKECGIKVPKSKSFTSFEDATAYIQSQDAEKRYVFKPSGSDSGNIPSFVSKDSESLVKMFELYKKQITGSIDFELQEFIEGIDISTEAWFSQGEMLYPCNHTLETKHLMNGDKGPSGGCSGNIVWAADPIGSFLVEETITKMQNFAAKNEYTGPLDVNAIISDHGIYGLEFTPRFGYDATPTFLCGMLEGEIGRFLADTARGQYTESSITVSSGFASGLKLSVSPWPFEHASSTASIPVKCPVSGMRAGPFYPYNVRLNAESGEAETSPSYGMVGIALGQGSTIEEAMDKSLKVAKKLEVPDAQYRTDLAEVFQKRYNKVDRMLSNLE